MNLLSFKNPEFWGLGGIIMLLILFHLIHLRYNQNKQEYASLIFFQPLKVTWKNKIKNFPFYLKLLILFLIIIALSRPQQKLGKIYDEKNGIDIIFVLDISISMNIQDFKPNRLEVAKQQIYEFIELRENDRMGLVVFGKDAFLQSPLTLDQFFLKEFVSRVDFLEEIKSKTAIGTAIATAILALKNSSAKNKIIILLTDGENNAGEIDPLSAADIANKYNIKIYSIGIGTPGKSIVNQVINDPIQGKIIRPTEVYMDESTLKKISQLTKGQYFNVKDKPSFKEAYATINGLEKTKISNIQYNYYLGYFPTIILAILILIVLEIILEYLILAKKPF